MSTESPVLLDGTLPRLDGTPQDLAEYRGKVVLVVNTASACGLTPQYEGLQALYEQHGDAGLVVLGFPANDFLEQEPGSDEEIGAFCQRNYGVTFPLFAKHTVLGEQATPLFAELTKASEAPEWNFTKYLLDRDGRFVQRFGARTEPSDPELVGAIERLL
ncbi:glutathione peroxidase [Patulibacter brassicae]|jgi:glutathione peroxidase|uniref:Glutathione peroxidase n=1 Tax=Patulibacter brassicae TaxID=1705717 RepID=A0ABU4VKE7_9ACTN|nr:glutathione peroxidase [Patulibacter brassicae]MDX8152321.1 glutathione peroxidase [Patulibacter brassicae]